MRQHVGLGQHGYSGLLHDLGLGQIRCFHRKVRIHDTGTSGGYVFGNTLKVGDGGLETVLDRAHLAAHLGNFSQSRINAGNGGVGAGNGGDTKLINGGGGIACGIKTRGGKACAGKRNIARAVERDLTAMGGCS